jgi:putative autoinducer-2 (AI-2) aldolase
MGRNIFQSEKPANMIKAVKAVVHKGISPEEAYNTIYNI